MLSGPSRESVEVWPTRELDVSLCRWRCPVWLAAAGSTPLWRKMRRPKLILPATNENSRCDCWMEQHERRRRCFHAICGRMGEPYLFTAAVQPSRCGSRRTR